MVQMHLTRLLLAWCMAVAVAIPTPTSLAQEAVVDSWSYLLQKPAEGWRTKKFDDSHWNQGNGGFGTTDTPGARVGTNWQTNDIWLRKTIELKSIPKSPAILIHHDEDVQVFINGRQVVALTGWTTDYKVLQLDEAAKSSIAVGSNLLAVHCKQISGGQFIDVHLVDADNIPKLPPAKRNTKPFVSELITQWGSEVTAENAWTEYPRPQLERSDWVCLNGHWDYAISSVDQKSPPSEWQGRILVPFSLESKLSEVQRLLDRSEALWYRRTFTGVKGGTERTLLNFEAVDYRCSVLINGKQAGTHQGGHTPFAIDVTDHLKDGQNELIVRIEDETEGWQLRGKQVVNARGIWYTQVSGIWQTVWLERVAPRYIEDLTIGTDAAKGTISVRPEFAGDHGTNRLRIVVKDGDRVVAEATGDAESHSLAIPDCKLWTPDSPHLYQLEVTLLSANNEVIDQVRSYAGVRSVGKCRDKDGHLRMTLNGKIVFHWGPLDQGWWPDGLLTPPSDEAMLFDIEYLKAAGFNMIRKHIKVEPRRYYYHCDRLGMMVWQDQVSAGNNPKWTRLDLNPEDAQWPDIHHQQYMLELERMIDHLESHPSIVVWVPFNEAWGQHRTMDVGKWTVERDPSRLVNVASGGNFWPVGDIVDEHRYPHPGFPFDAERYKDFVKVVGEFGGHGYPVQGHLWNVNARNWGYGGLPQNEQEYKERYVESLKILNELRQQGIAAGIYTQTTDVEGEINGLLTYDRKVIKIPAKELTKLHESLLEPIACAP